LNSAKKILVLFLIIISITSIEIIAKTRIAILYSESTLRTFNFNPNDYLNEYTAWEIFLMQNKIDFSVIYDEDLENGIEDEADILILPKYIIQSKEVISVIQNYLQNGKSVLLANTSISSSIINSNNELRDLFGLTLTDPGFDKKLNFTQTVFGNFLNSYKKNSAFLISAEKETQFVDLKHSNCSAAGYILDTAENNNVSSMVYGKSNYGKFVFIGFGLTDLIGGSKEKLDFELFLIDALKWLDIEVDAFPIVTINKKEKSRLLFVEYNNALNENFINALKQNGFNPHIIINGTVKPDEVLLNLFPVEQVVIDIRDLENKNSLIEEIITKLKIFESQLKLPVESVLLNTELQPYHLNQLKEYGIKNFVSFQDKFTEAKIDDDKCLFLFINRSDQPSLPKQFETFYYVPLIDCEQDLETNYLTSLKNHSDDQIIFTDINSLRIKLELEKNLVLRVEQNEEIELVIRNQNLVEVNDLTLYVNMNGFQAVRGSSSLPLNHSIDPMNGMIKIYIKKVYPRSEERVFLTEGN
jgi:hypothetical protein